VVDAVEPRIRELLQACPTMPATVIAERIEWRCSIRTLSGRAAELRPIYVPPDPASRTSYSAGEIAQCDFWSRVTSAGDPDYRDALLTILKNPMPGHRILINVGRGCAR
jgi:hypothetical protein